jgi:hypothetical protein
VASITTTGLATAQGLGSSKISATMGSISGSTTLTVTAAALESIAVTPANPSIAKGTTQQFTATGTYSDNSTQDLTSQVTWASADTTVASITTTGLATAQGLGSSKISATMGSISGSTVLTVTVPVLSPVAVKDNSQGGYYEYGTWTILAGGYNGTYAVANPTTSSAAIGFWNLVVPAGTYDIYASWVAAATDATNAGYSIYDGFNKLGTVQENEQLAPGDGQYGGVLWAKLGTYSITKRKIAVTLSASGANGNIVADAILLVPSVSVTGAVAEVLPAPGGGSSSTPGPTGPIGLATTSGPDQRAGAATAIAPSAAQAPASQPGGTIAPAIPITVKYVDDSSTGSAVSASEASTTASLTDHALGEIVMTHRPGRHGSLVAHLAHEQVSGKRLRNHHHRRP